jgi:hypothetical protein
LQPRLWGQAGNSLLAEVLYRATAVAAPLVGGRVVTIVDRHESEFVQPGSDRAVGRDVSTCDARAHGHAEHAIFAKAHRTSERSDLPIVRDFEWDAAPGFLQVEEDAPNALLEIRGRDPAKE